MKPSKIITILNNIKSADDLLSASARIPDVCFDFIDMRAYVRRDLRSEIKQALSKHKISARQLAMCVGCDYPNFTKYLKGERTLPEKYLERVLKILQI